MIRFAYGKVTITTLATQIVPDRVGRKELRIFSVGTGVFLGPDDTLTVSNGLPTSVPAALAALADTPIEGSMYGIVSTGAVSVSFVEIYDDAI